MKTNPLKNTKRISFDNKTVNHTYLKVKCAELHIALRDLMNEITEKTIAEMKQKERAW